MPLDDTHLKAHVKHCPLRDITSNHHKINDEIIGFPCYVITNLKIYGLDSPKYITIVETFLHTQEGLYLIHDSYWISLQPLTIYHVDLKWE